METPYLAHELCCHGKKTNRHSFKVPQSWPCPQGGSAAAMSQTRLFMSLKSLQESQDWMLPPSPSSSPPTVYPFPVLDSQLVLRFGPSCSMFRLLKSLTTATLPYGIFLFKLKTSVAAFLFKESWGGSFQIICFLTVIRHSVDGLKGRKTCRHPPSIIISISKIHPCFVPARRKFSYSSHPCSTQCLCYERMLIKFEQKLT